MKKIILVAALAGLTVASCRKDRTCTCVQSDNNPGSSSTTTVKTQTKMTANGAAEWCQSGTEQQTAPVTSTYIVTFNCTLS